MKTIDNRTLLGSHSLLLRKQEVASMDLTLGSALFRVNVVLDSSGDGVVKWDQNSEGQSVTLRIFNTEKGTAAVSEKNIAIISSGNGDVIYGQFAIQHFVGGLSAVIVQFTLSKAEPTKSEVVLPSGS